MAIQGKITAHFKKHRRKYAAGTLGMVGIYILKIMLVTGTFFGIATINQRLDTEDEKIRMTETVEAIGQIDTLAHDFFDDRAERGEKEDPGITARFKEIDEEFHNAQTLNERYKAAKKMEIFFDEMDQYLHRTNGLITREDIEKDKKYHELKIIFDNIR